MQVIILPLLILAIHKSKGHRQILECYILLVVIKSYRSRKEGVMFLNWMLVNLKCFLLLIRLPVFFLFFFLQYVKTQQAFMGMINFFVYVTVT